MGFSNCYKIALGRNKQLAKNHDREVIEWKEKIEANKIEAYSEIEKSCLKQEFTRYELLEKLKNEVVPGPFTSEHEIKQYLLNEKK